MRTSSRRCERDQDSRNMALPVSLHTLFSGESSMRRVLSLWKEAAPLIGEHPFGEVLEEDLLGARQILKVPPGRDLNLGAELLPHDLEGLFDALEEEACDELDGGPPHRAPDDDTIGDLGDHGEEIGQTRTSVDVLRSKQGGNRRGEGVPVDRVDPCILWELGLIDALAENAVQVEHEIQPLAPRLGP